MSRHLRAMCRSPLIAPVYLAGLPGINNFLLHLDHSLIIRQKERGSSSCHQGPRRAITPASRNFGFLFDATGSYTISFVIFTLSFFISAFLLLPARPPK